MKEIEARSDCPVSFALDFLGDKWTLLILRDMMLKNKSTYGDFLNSDEGIATNILADRLVTLEKHGFVTKRTASDKKSKFIYRMTEKGIDLVPVVMELSIWGAKYSPFTDKALADEYRKNRADTILRFQEKLRSVSI